MVIPGSDDTHLPYIGAVDPQNPDVLYVRLDGSPTDQLLVSRDGGATWTKVFETKIPEPGDTADLLGFALSPGYNATLFNQSGNPIGGRAAYCGQSASYPSLATVNASLAPTAPTIYSRWC